MRKYLLDTAPLAAFLLGRRKAVETITPWLNNKEVVTSIIVDGEVDEYLKILPNYSLLHLQLRRQLRAIKPCAITYSIMEEYADIRMRMRAPFGKGLIGDADTMIAATAREYSLTLVTADSHFDRVPGLVTARLTAK